MISVHAVSLIYELRALRSRLDQSIAQGALYHKDAEWMLTLVTHMIGKVERTGAFIEGLKDENTALRAAAEARLGQELPTERGRSDGRHHREPSPRPRGAH